MSSGLDDGVNVQGTCRKKKPDTRRIEIREIQALFSRNDIVGLTPGPKCWSTGYGISYTMSKIFDFMSHIIDFTA